MYGFLIDSDSSGQIIFNNVVIVDRICCLYKIIIKVVEFVGWY